MAALHNPYKPPRRLREGPADGQEDEKSKLADDVVPGHSAPTSSRGISARTAEVLSLFENACRVSELLTGQADALYRRHVIATDEDDVSSKHKRFIARLKDARAVANELDGPQSDETKNLKAALRDMEHDCSGMYNKCQDWSAISKEGVSLAQKLSEASQSLINLCSWMLNDKLPIEEPFEVSDLEHSDDHEATTSSSKKRCVTQVVADVRDAQVPHASSRTDAGQKEASARLVPSTSERIKQTKPKTKKMSSNDDIEWDTPSSSVEIVLGWTKPGGSMRRLLDSLVNSVRAKGIIFLDGPDGADDADEDSRAKWYREHMADFEAAVKPIVAAYKKDEISSLFCPYCRNRQREGHNASSAIREHWKKYHARTHKG